MSEVLYPVEFQQLEHKGLGCFTDSNDGGGTWLLQYMNGSMSTCRWCTPGGPSTVDFLKEYASKRLSKEDSLSANEDLSYCLECVVEYHKARDELPTLHKLLWEMEATRLVTHFEKSMKDESVEEDELFFVEEDGETKLPDFVGPDFENNLRVPLLEILKYPYLLLHEQIGELCVEALCKMERVNYSFQVFDKHPGIYMLLVHPNEMIRRWAIMTARSLGKVDRDDYYDLQEVFTCLFKVIELGLFDSPEIYNFTTIDKGKLLLLPSHLYDTSNYKNYWLGICMLLTVLEEQAMDSLLLGPDKQNDFMQSILHTMEKDTSGDGDDPFWPALRCFMVILDRLGAKVWGQLIDPIQAFQTIIDSTSYKNEIESIRNGSRRTKIEPPSDYGDDLVSCSQMVYDFNTEKPKKDSGWRSAICPDYCPNMYEEMQTLTNVLQSDIGQDMRVHNSTFLWFIPFVQSVMDLKDLGVAYIVEVIHHLYSEIKDVLNKRVEQCDKVTEFFILILVSVIELHRNKKCLHLLWVSSQKWVEALVKCAKLPAKDFRRFSEKIPGACSRISSTSSSTALSMHSQASNSVQYSCVQLIRSLLREGSQLGQQASCKHFLDKLNHLLRGNIFLGLQLSEKETQDLQVCLKQVIRSSKDRTFNITSSAEQNALGRASPFSLSRIKREDTDEWRRMKEYCQSNSPSPPPPFDSTSHEGCSSSPASSSRNNIFEEEAYCKEPPMCGETGCPSPQKEPAFRRPSEMHTNHLEEIVSKSAQYTETNIQGDRGPTNLDTDNQEPFTRESVWQGRYELENFSASNVCSPPYQGECDLSKEKGDKPPSSSESDTIPPKIKNVKVNFVDLHSRLAKAMEKSSNFLKLQKSNQNPEEKAQKQSKCPSPGMTTVHSEDQRGNLETTFHPKSSGNEQSTTKAPAVPGLRIKEEPEERCLDLYVAKKKSDYPDKVSGSDSDDSLPLSLLKDNLVKRKQSSFGSTHSETSVYTNLGLSADRQPSDASESRLGNSPDKAMGISPVKLFEKASESDSDDGIPLTQVRHNLVKQRKSLYMHLDTSGESDVDGELNRQPLASRIKVEDCTLDPNLACMPTKDYIERKVKGTIRSSVPQKNRKSPGLSDEIIVISDSAAEEETSSDEETIRAVDKPIKEEKQDHEEGYRGMQPSSASVPPHFQKEIKREVVEAEKSPERCDEYNSQFFEFETEDEVYSVWQDSQVKKEPPVDVQDQVKDDVQDQVKDPTSTPAQDDDDESDFDLTQKYIEWGYDTDYISEDLIEEAGEAAEKQFAEKKLAETKSSEGEVGDLCKDPTSRGHTTQPDNNADKYKHAKPADSAVKNTTKNVIAKIKPSIPPESSLEKCKNSNANSSRNKIAKPVKARTETLTKISKSTSFGAARQNKTHFGQTSPRKREIPRTTPLVVPPKKDRRLPEPTSTVEKLGLKKPPRKAFDLSQTSLDSLAQLRSHGKDAGTFEVKRKQRTRLCSPQALPVKGNRKLLACQDRQFYRQTRPQEGKKAKEDDKASESENKVAQSKAISKVPRKEPSSEDTVTVTGNRHIVKNTAAAENEKPLRRDTAVKEDIPAPDLSKTVRNVNVALPLSGPVDTDSRITTHTVVENQFDYYYDGDAVHPASPSFLDIQDPSLREANAQSNEDEEEMEVDELFLTQPDPVDMEICSQEENVGNIETFTHSDQADMEIDRPEVLPTDALPPEHYKCKHAQCVEIVKMPGFFCRKHVVVEMSGGHVFAMPGLPPSFLKPAKPPTAKMYSSGVPSRSANLSKDLENIPKPSTAMKNKSQVAMPPIPKKNAPELIKNISLRPSSPCTVLQDLMNQSNITHGWSTGRTSDGAGSESGQNPRAATTASYAPPKKRDQTFLIQEILRWSHEMFTSFIQFGAPNNLCQFSSKNVPLSFSGYEEYFHIFFPLLILNTFESMAQEWLENQKNKFRSTYQLQLQNFCTDRQMNRVEFQVWIRDANLAKQLHLKEDDLVFLIDPKDQQSDDGEVHSQPVYHIGHVARFSRSQMNELRSGDKYTACNLIIQTKGKFMGARNQLVKCEVIGGLLSTQRQFKALLQLRWSPLVKPIIQPNPPEFFPSNKVNLVTESNMLSYLKDYNENQKKAIETAYAMVKQHPTLPRICLIHGPPGTGKSKTIVGLLQRVLTEKPTEAKKQNLNAKNKRNRVLVCAPSNAGIDELMKKIILGFKENCQNKNSFLGNCGDINLVRLGSEKAISSDVQRFSLDSQVSRKMNRNAFGLDQDIERKKEALDRRLDELSRQRAMERCDKQMRNEELDQEIGRVAAERQQLATQLKEVRKHLPEVQGSIILESHIICCTLNTSGSFLLEAAFRRLGHDPFSCVIVDEAGQACEVETLIPLTHRCSKLILVGDPEQLPATVISPKAQEYGYGQSMMARLRTRLEGVTSKTPVLQLTVQYRMHPDICLFPSNYIYGKTLRTDRMTEEIRCSADWPFQPYLLFDVSDGTERRENDSSYANFQEVKLVIALIKLIKDKKKDLGFRHIGIITPYRAQKNMIIQELDKEFGKPNRPGEVDTVDGFQGRQKDCIIVTCVRANACQGSIGFLASRQRLNVTITRAKNSLFILGSLKTLMENKDWNELIQDAQRRGAIIKTREDNYNKDVTKILKLKPTFQRSVSHPPVIAAKEKASSRPHCTPPCTERKELANGSDILRLPLPLPLPTPRASLPYPQPAQQPLNFKRAAAEALIKAAGVAPVQAIAPPAPHERPRDPRLARKVGAAGPVNQPTPNHSGHTLPHDSGERRGQAKSVLPHRTVAGANSPSQSSHPSSASTSASRNSRNTDYRPSWQDRREQGNCRNYSENKQWGTRRDLSPENRKGSEKSRQETKRQKTSRYDS